MKRAKLSHHAKFRGYGSNVAVIWVVSIFKNGGRRHLGVLKFQNFKRRVKGVKHYMTFFNCNTHSSPSSGIAT